MSHNHQKKIAVINDLSGFGRCSIAVALPLISHLGVQCCPLPTAIFSNHTGFNSFYFDDYTHSMGPYMAEWEKLGLEFEGILTGFLGSEQQIGLVEQFIETFSTERTTVIMDPVMGDNGRPYATYTPELCQEMKRLVRHADILTPNLTEACILTDTPYQVWFSEGQLLDMARRLCDQGPEKVVVTASLGERIWRITAMNKRAALQYSGRNASRLKDPEPVTCLPPLLRRGLCGAYPLPSV